MKNSIIILNALLVISITSCQNISEEAAKYNNKIIDVHTDLVDQLDELKMKGAEEDVDRLRKEYNKTLEEANKTLTFADTLTPFPNDDSFRIGLVNYSKGAIAALENEFDSIIYYVSIPDTAYTVTDSIAYFRLVETFDAKLLELQGDFVQAQADFAKKHEFSLE